MATNFVGADIKKKEDPSKKYGITDVYIAVFFDGTGNNMLRSASETIEKYRKKINKNSENYKKVENEEELASQIEDNILELDDSEMEKFIQLEYGETLAEFIESKKIALSVSEPNPFKRQQFLTSSGERLVKENRSDILNFINENYSNRIAKFKNAHNNYKPTSFGKFSNIAILYHNYNPVLIKSEKTTKKYDLYIEGVGKTDLSHNIISGNYLDAGFGTGSSGVIALVSKAVSYINNFINSIKGEFDDDKVQFHFQAYGFSRGATCARLFSYLVTRTTTETLKRESEFKDHYAKGLFKNNRLEFLDEYKSGKKYEITVDFLGIYDTVSSIHMNDRFNNVTEYGLFSTSNKYAESHKDKMKNICHIGAMDEFRYNFAFTDVGKDVGNNAIEVLMPGCHSDIGGGYYDGEIKATTKLEKIEQKRIVQITRYPYSKQLISPLNFNYFSELGWLDKGWNTNNKQSFTNISGKKVAYTIDVDEDDECFEFTRNVKAGYSNVPLHLMANYATKWLGNEGYTKLFNPEMKTNDYPVPEDLVSFYNYVEGKFSQKGKRIVVQPNDDDYKNLRMRYLHFSADNNFVNKVNYDADGCIARIVYHGDENDTTSNVMYDYNGSVAVYKC